MKFRKYTFLIAFIFISFIPIFDLFKPGLPLTHDGQDHVARIANFYQNLSEGNIIPRWAGNLNWGYGHPILEFLYPLPSYLASLFHFFGFNLIDSVKIVFGTAFILSGLAMYLFVRELLSDDKTAFFASLLYIIAPYRFVDLYVRGAIGEHVAFIFPPLVFYFLLKLSKNYSYWHILGGSFSLAGLILSHNAITLMFLPLFCFYAIFLVLSSKNKINLIGKYALTVLLGFGLSAFFWIPAFMEGKYTLRDVVTGGGEYARSFVMWKDFFTLAWSYGGSVILSKQVGIIHWISVFGSVIAILYLYKKRNKLWMLCLGSFFIFWVTLFLMTETSNPIWQSITMLQKFQFPWRLLSITVFLSTLLGAIILHTSPNRYKKITLLMLIVFLLIINKDYWHAQGYLTNSESFFTGIYSGTTDTGESAPIWSVRFMEKKPSSRISVLEGKAEIKEISRRIIKREYALNVLKESRILENTLYFPGWQVFVDGKITDVQFQDPSYRGLITFYIDKGKHNVEIMYKETKMRQLSDSISAISLIIVGVYFLSLAKKRLY